MLASKFSEKDSNDSGDSGKKLSWRHKLLRALQESMAQSLQQRFGTTEEAGILKASFLLFASVNV
jgi:hypothetical protein